MGWDDRTPLSGLYDWAEFTLTNGSTNYDVGANVAGLFSNILVARKVVIETTKNITARFNRTTLPAVKIDAGASPVELKELIEIKSIYLTNASGSDSTIRIWLI